jgi:PAS domain S-box-containing protein/putative nucleotidyltransferase with HDIG domain
MPGMNGFEVCRQIKEDQKLRNIPVIMITASIVKQDRILGIEAGAEEFLSKPFDLAEVLARIKMLLKMKGLDDERKCAESQREAAFAELQKSHDELDRRVRERTAELSKANETLRADIIERKRAEEVLRESEIRYRELFENMGSGVSVYETRNNGEDFIFKEYNAAAEMIDKTLRGQVIGRSVVDVFPGVKDFGLFDVFQRVYRTGKSERFPATFYKDEKISGWRENYVYKLPSGEVVSVFDDVTESKQAEEKLLESKTLFEAVVENIPLMIFLKEATDLRFVIFNRAGEELLGHDRKDLLGKNNLDLFPPEQAANFMAKDREVLDGKAIMMDIPEEQMQTAKKGQRLLHTKKVCIRSTDGTTKYLLGISEDITERKLAEKELQGSLDNLSKAFNTIVQVLISAVEMRDPYTADHQLRVANIACGIAKEMGLPNDKIEGIRMAGSIHDIGKLSIPAEILSKPTKLTEIEFSLIKAHAQSGYEMLKNVESPWPLAQIVYQHHERMNGSGYPKNLKGNEILMEARIMAVADVVEAMASHRPYRPSLGMDAALAEIEKNKVIFYDSTVADACLRLFREKGYQLT